MQIECVVLFPIVSISYVNDIRTSCIRNASTINQGRNICGALEKQTKRGFPSNNRHPHTHSAKQNSHTVVPPLPPTHSAGLYMCVWVDDRFRCRHRHRHRFIITPRRLITTRRGGKIVANNYCLWGCADLSPFAGTTAPGM